MKKRIINIVNFVRGCEPRQPWQDLFTPAVEELRVNREHGLSSTVLLQYDALVRKDFCDFYRAGQGDDLELGLWFEMARCLTESVGIPWRGRPGYDWDWYVDPGFLPAYELSQREALIDACFEKFREVFGRYPRVAGSWILDAHSMNYMCEKYGMDAFCICREQYAVDAYTLWGGPYNGGYYASKNNILCPAQTESEKIPAPVFRMLGIDPAYGYYENRYSGCPTLEPVWFAGSHEDSVEWFLDAYLRNSCLAFSQITTGQENSFGWDWIKPGYLIQADAIARRVEKGEVSVQTLGKTGQDFKNRYRLMPPQCQTVSGMWNGDRVSSVWYNCVNYRANLYLEGERLYFRDINIFDQSVREPCASSACHAWQLRFDNLPVVDARLWRGTVDGRLAESGLYFDEPVRHICSIEEGNLLEVTVTFISGRQARVLMSEDGITVSGVPYAILLTGVPEENVTVTGPDGTGKIAYCKNGYAYGVGYDGEYESVTDGWKLKADRQGRIYLGMVK